MGCMHYALVLVIFLCSAAVSTLAIARAPRLWIPAASLLPTMSLWIALVAARPMTPTTASIAAVAADACILAIGMCGSMRLLSMFDAPSDPSDGWRVVFGDVDAPDSSPPGASTLPALNWTQIESELARWERTRDATFEPTPQS